MLANETHFLYRRRRRFPLPPHVSHPMSHAPSPLCLKYASHDGFDLWIRPTSLPFFWRRRLSSTTESTTLAVSEVPTIPRPIVCLIDGTLILYVHLLFFLIYYHCWHLFVIPGIQVLLYSYMLRSISTTYTKQNSIPCPLWPVAFIYYHEGVPSFSCAQPKNGRPLHLDVHTCSYYGTPTSAGVLPPPESVQRHSREFSAPPCTQPVVANFYLRCLTPTPPPFNAFRDPIFLDRCG